MRQPLLDGKIAVISGADPGVGADSARVVAGAGATPMKSTSLALWNSRNFAFLTYKKQPTTAEMRRASSC